jgi:long-chain acyl-CoA synthetase
MPRPIQTASQRIELGHPGNGAMLAPMFFAHAARTPTKPAIHCADAELNYRDLARLVCRWSNAMASRGVERGDHIAVILPNDIKFVALLLAAADLGAVLVPLNTALAPPEVHTAFVAADVKHVVATAAVLRSLLRAPHSMADFAQGLWVSVDEAVDEPGMPGTTPLSDLLQDALPNPAPLHAASGDDALILSMTSGSTGDPKPIILTQLTKINRVRAAVELYGITDSDRVLAATPLYHSLAERLVLIPLLTGGTSVLMPRFSPAAWLRCVREHAVTFSIAVSSQLKQIAAELDVEAHGHDITSLRCIVSSSALLDDQTKADVLRKFACEVHECYGASEIAIASNLNSARAATKLRSVGNAAPGVDIRILGKNDVAVGPGEAGEIVCKTPMLFGGYFKRPDLTQRAMWGEYFRTGDMGKLDEDGYLHFLGRSKDIIICGGVNVYPEDIETVVNAYPAVLESAAFAFPDARLGEVVAIALVLADKIAFDLKSLRFHCCERLADFQQPRKFFLLDELPRNPMGKLVKFRLVKMFVAGPGQTA